jgi:hypothetical protein
MRSQLGLARQLEGPKDPAIGRQAELPTRSLKTLAASLRAFRRPRFFLCRRVKALSLFLATAGQSVQQQPRAALKKRLSRRPERRGSPKQPNSALRKAAGQPKAAGVSCRKAAKPEACEEAGQSSRTQPSARLQSQTLATGQPKAAEVGCRRASEASETPKPGRRSLALLAAGSSSGSAGGRGCRSLGSSLGSCLCLGLSLRRCLCLGLWCSLGLRLRSCSSLGSLALFLGSL